MGDFTKFNLWYWSRLRKFAAFGEQPPSGGKHLSPRQHLRQLKPASTSFDSIVRSVRNYRRKFPDKAVTYNANIHCRAQRDGWAILMGGGSLPNVPELSRELSKAIMNMKPSDRLKLEEGQWCLSNSDREYLIYTRRDHPSQIRLPSAANWEWCSVDPKSGRNGDYLPADSRPIPVAAGTKLVWARAND